MGPLRFPFSAASGENRDPDPRSVGLVTSKKVAHLESPGRDDSIFDSYFFDGLLGGCFKYFLFTPLFGEGSHFD